MFITQQTKTTDVRINFFLSHFEGIPLDLYVQFYFFFVWIPPTFIVVKGFRLLPSHPFLILFFLHITSFSAFHFLSHFITPSLSLSFLYNIGLLHISSLPFPSWFPSSFHSSSLTSFSLLPPHPSFLPSSIIIRVVCISCLVYLWCYHTRQSLFHSFCIFLFLCGN